MGESRDSKMRTGLAVRLLITIGPLLAVVCLIVWVFQTTEPGSRWYLRRRVTVLLDSNPRFAKVSFDHLDPLVTTRRSVEAVLGPSSLPWTEGRVYLAPYERTRRWRETSYYFGLVRASRYREETRIGGQYRELEFIDDRLVGCNTWRGPSTRDVRAVQRTRLRRDAGRLTVKSGQAKGKSLPDALILLNRGDSSARLRGLFDDPSHIWVKDDLEVWEYSSEKVNWTKDDGTYLPTRGNPVFVCFYFKSGLLLDSPIGPDPGDELLDPFDGWPTWKQR